MERSYVSTQKCGCFFESPKCAISPYPFIRQINPRPAPSGTALCGIWHGMPAICACIVSGTSGMIAKAVSGVRADSQTQPRETFMEAECMTTCYYINILNYGIFTFPLPPVESQAESEGSGSFLLTWTANKRDSSLCNLNRLSFMCVCGGLFCLVISFGGTDILSDHSQAM